MWASPDALAEVGPMSDRQERRINLLIVDDEVDFLEALGERLEMRDFHVRTAVNGAEALELCRAEKFDLALIDLKMPGMDGRELLTRLKEEHRFLEVVILTGHGSLGSAVECAKLGAFGYLPKPYQLDELLTVLKDAYAERLKKKFAADEERSEQLAKIAMEDSPRRILQRMKELDDDER
jgi:DNA-binding NtrC family response regulator